MNNKINLFVSVTVMLIMLTSCAVSRKGTIAITKPIRTIEELTTGNNGPLKQEDIPKIIAIAQLGNETSAAEAPAVLRAILQSHLSNKNFQLIHTKEIDLKDPNNNLSPKQLARTLGADAILTGKVTQYQRLYAGIYAQIKLGVSITLISKEGKKLWHEEKTITSRAGGISVSPWGILLNAALAAMHLEDKNLFAAADELGRAIAATIPEPSGYIGSKLPRIDMVIHDGANKWLKYGDKLTLAIKGQQGLRAIADIEGIGTFDLTEQQPGFYRTQVVVDKRWNGAQKVITGKLIDNKGQIAVQISSTGLVNFDNQKPSNISNLKVDFASPNEIKLSWDKNKQEPVSYKIGLQARGKNQLVATTNKNSVLLTGNFTPFETRQYNVVALDKAKNPSNASDISIPIYPLKLSHVNILDSLLAGSYTGISALTRRNSPYVITANTVFPVDSMLLVEPGVAIKFKQATNLTIEGIAYFWGQQKSNSKRAIIFNNESSKSPTQKYLILDSTKTVEITGLTLLNAGIGIEIKSGKPTINHFIASHSKYSALTIGGNASVKLSNCQLNGSSSSAIVISGRSRLQLENCNFSNNKPFHIQNASPFAVRAKKVSFDKSAMKAVLGAITMEN